MRIIPIDKLKTLCYDVVVNKNDSQIGGAYGAKYKAIPKAKRDPELR